MKVDLEKPILAEIYDYDSEYIEPDENGKVIRKVESIEFACKHHDGNIIWYSNGFKSKQFKIIGNEVQQ